MLLLTSNNLHLPNNLFLIAFLAVHALNIFFPDLPRAHS